MESFNNYSTNGVDTTNSNDNSFLNTNYSESYLLNMTTNLSSTIQYPIRKARESLFSWTVSKMSPEQLLKIVTHYNYVGKYDIPLDMFISTCISLGSVNDLKGQISVIWTYIRSLHYLPKYELFKQDFVLFMKYIAPDTVKPTSFSGMLERGLDFFDHILDNPSDLHKHIGLYHVKKIFTFLIYQHLVPNSFNDIISFMELNDDGDTKRLKEKGITKTYLIGVFKSISKLLRKYQLGQDIYDIHDISVFIAEVDWLRSNNHNRSVGGKITNEEWMQRLERAYKARFKIRVDYSDGFTNTKTLVTRALKEIDYLWHYCKYDSDGMRPNPVVVGIYGDSGSGKTSYVIPCMSQVLQRAYDIEAPDIKSGLYPLNPNDPFMSGYIPGIHPCILIDEIGAYKNCERNTNNIVSNQILEMLSSGKLVLNSASLEDKGKRVFSPYGIFIASNFADFGAPAIVNHKEAFINRLDFVVRIKIKDEFKMTDSEGTKIGGMDNDKIRIHQEKMLEEDPEAKKYNEFYPVEFWICEKQIDSFVQGKEKVGFIDMMKLFNAKVYQEKKKNIELSKRQQSSFDILLTSGEYWICPNILWRGLGWIYIYLQMLLWLWFWRFLSILYYPFSFILDYSNYFTNKIRSIKLEMFYHKIGAVRMAAGDLYERTKVRIKNSDPWYSGIMIAVATTAITLFLSKIQLGKQEEDDVPESNVAELDGVRRESKFTVINRKDNTLVPTSHELFGSIPPKYIESMNCIYNNKKEISYIMGRSSGVLESDLIRQCIGNIYDLHIANLKAANRDMKGNRCHLFGVGGCYYLMPYHAAVLMGEDTLIELSQFINADGDEFSERCVSVMHTIDYHDGLWRRVSEDVAMIYLPHIQPRKDLTKYFLRDFGNLHRVGTKNIFYNKKNELTIEKISCSKSQINYPIYTREEITKVYPQTFSGEASFDGFPGQCGSPLIAEIGKQCGIIGINIGCMKKHATTQHFHTVTLQQIELAKDKFKDNFNIIEPTAKFDFVDTHYGSIYKDDIQELTPKRNHLPWIDPEEIGSTHTLGYIDKLHFHQTKSGVYKLPTYNYFFNHMPVEYLHTLITPNFRSYFKDGEYKGVYKNMLMSSRRPASNINMLHLNKVTTHLSNKFSSILSVDDIQIWDIDHATSGRAGNLRCSKLPNNTGAGIPYNCKKKELLIPISTETIPDGMVPNDELRSEIKQIITNMSEGIRPYAINKACMKDEPRKAKKVIDRKIRIFTIPPITMVIIQKMYFGSIVGRFMDEFLTFETVCGVNCYSDQWQQVFDYLDVFDAILGGDYESYDKLICSIIILAVGWIFKDIYRKFDQLSVKRSNVIDGIFNEIAYPIISINGELVSYAGVLCSGIWLTLIINNIANSIYIRLSWLSVSDKNLDDFEELARFIALGDDNLLSVHHSVLDYFNFTTIKAFFKRMGINYTDPEKTSETYISRTKDRATIAKRFFVKYDNIMRAPIEKSSIGKCLTMAIKGSPLNDDELIKASCQSAVIELAQFGREEYDKIIPIWQNMLKEVDVNMTLPNYDEVIYKIDNQGDNPWNVNYDIIDYGDEEIMLTSGWLERKVLNAKKNLDDLPTLKDTLSNCAREQISQLFPTDIRPAVNEGLKIVSNKTLVGFIITVCYERSKLIPSDIMKYIDSKAIDIVDEMVCDLEQADNLIGRADYQVPFYSLYTTSITARVGYIKFTLAERWLFHREKYKNCPGIYSIRLWFRNMDKLAFISKFGFVFSIQTLLNMIPYYGNLVPLWVSPTLEEVLFQECGEKLCLAFGEYFVLSYLNGGGVNWLIRLMPLSSHILSLLYNFSYRYCQKEDLNKRIIMHTTYNQIMAYLDFILYAPYYVVIPVTMFSFNSEIRHVIKRLSCDVFANQLSRMNT